jgi:hypothetical protein
MKKQLNIYLICLFTMLGLQELHAQTRKTLTISASANVTDNLQMITIRHLDLVSPEVEDGFVEVSPIYSSWAGMFKVIGNPNAKIRITYLQSESLREQNDGIGVVEAQYFMSASAKDLQQQSQLLDVGEAIVPIGENGELFIWLGAVLDFSNALPGLYLSEFILELEYI